MTARTHTEIYRRYDGELSTHPLRAWPLWASGVRVGTKKKLQLLVLYAPAVITTIVFSFMVYGKYVAEGAASQPVVSFQGFLEQAASRAATRIEVRDIVMRATVTLRWFAVLVTAWFGAGLLADDRRLGAHLLYFARPLTRLDYFLGKLLTVSTFAAFASLLPGLFICFFAAWSSPEWSFLKYEGDVIWKNLAYSALWILATSSVVLAFSSLFRRKTFALVACFAYFMPFHVLSKVLSSIDKRFQFVSLFDSLQRIGNWMLDIDNPWENKIPLAVAWAMVGGVTAIAIGVVALRLRRLEVVA